MIKLLKKNKVLFVLVPIYGRSMEVYKHPGIITKTPSPIEICLNAMKVVEGQ